MGPFTHPYINMRALDRAKRLARGGDPGLNRALLEMLTSGRDIERLFIYAGNSADVISTYHIINRQFFAYDYAHNNNPDDVTGIPNFGYSLVDECRPGAGNEGRWLSREDYIRDFAIACGWVSHQIADWYSHYVCVNRDGRRCGRYDDEDEGADGVTTFPGYSNSHRIFGADYPVPFLQRYRVVDHGLLEFFIDILMLDGDSTGMLENPRVELFGSRRPPHPNLLTAASEKFGRQARIPPEDVEPLERDMNLVIAGLRILIELARVRCPSLCRDISSIVDREYIELAADRVVEHLFRRSFDEISELARRNRVFRNPRSPIGPIGGALVSQPGTPIFEVAYNLASSLVIPGYGGLEGYGIDRDEALRRVLEIIRDPLLLLRGVGPAGWLMSVRWLRRFIWMHWVKPRIDKFISSTLRQLGRVTVGASSRSAYNALMGFLSTLLLAGGSIQEARLDFKKNLRPVILLEPGAAWAGHRWAAGDAGSEDEDGEDGGEIGVEMEMKTEMEILRDLIMRARELNFRVFPGISESDRASKGLPKYLDPATLVMNINGYPPSLDPGFCLMTWEFEDGDEWGPLLISCRFRRPVMPGRYDFSIRIKDGSQVDSEYFYRSVIL
ncbi:MAG: hypothetical protein HPY71_10845 [Firmicutes bacterium]|nr:hypothetical protein [Bacillota bacterium]